MADQLRLNVEKFKKDLTLPFEEVRNNSLVKLVNRNRGTFNIYDLELKEIFLIFIEILVVHFLCYYIQYSSIFSKYILKKKINMKYVFIVLRVKIISGLCVDLRRKII